LTDRTIIHSSAELVEVTYRPELAAVYLKWFSEYDKGTRVRDAVLTAINWVRDHDVKHWVADVSTSPLALSEADYEWVSGDEFRTAIIQSPLRKFVLIPPLPETGQDIGWVADWESGTLASFGEGVAAKVCRNTGEMNAFLSV